MMIPFEIAAKFLGVGTASGTRAALAMLVVAGLGRAGVVEMPASVSFLTSTPWLGAMLAATVVEELLERDDDAQQLLAILKYGVHGTGGIVVAWLLVERFGLPLDGWPVAAIGGALALLTHNMRMRVHTALAAISAGIVSPRRWLSWLEAGGVLGLTVAVVLSPAVALAFVFVAFSASVGMWAMFRSLEKLRRHTCPTCRAQVRKEARLCPHCREALPIGRWVGDGLLDKLEQKTSRS
ncbi:MAG TPA: zinc ribbon domain-containing protein [Polyangiaceae bacterium]|nr:zinc ribbon domain-containing protein [Polyangiaceae bacterium]